MITLQALRPGHSQPCVSVDLHPTGGRIYKKKIILINLIIQTVNVVNNNNRN